MCARNVSRKYRPQKGQPSGCIKKENQDTSKEGKKCRKGTTRRLNPLHISEMIHVTIVIIAISMVTLKKSVGNYI
jgi:hypothetical protein